MSHESVQCIRIYYQYADDLSVQNKQQQLRKALKDYSDADIIIFVDTNLDKEIHTGVLFSDDFNVIRRDKSEQGSKRGGLIVAYLKKSIITDAIIREEFSCGSRKTVEDLWLTLTLKNNEILHICITHLHPLCKFDSFQQFFTKLKSNVGKNKRENFAIIGSFNFDDFNKFSENLIKFKKSGTKLDVMYKCTKGLKQINRIKNNDDEMLDMIFTSVKGTVELSNFQLIKQNDKHPALHVKLIVQKSQVNDDDDKTAKLERELESLKRNFQCFKVAHDEQIRQLSNEIERLKGVLEEEGIIE